MDLLNHAELPASPYRNSRRIMKTTFASIVFLSLLIILWPSRVSAQLSPGDLNTVHADLEGLKNCSKCHETGNQISGQNCLDCHKELKKRIDAKKGLHASDGYQQCTNCHVEHLGKDSQLVWWKDGQDNFNHLLTGYALLGKHVGLECRRCHVKRHIVDKEILESKTKQLNRTFLGLSKECTGCHVDEHRGQESSDCLKCHDMNGWKTQPGFKHQNTKFPLTGKHLNVKCEKCHKPITDNLAADNPDYLKLKGLEYSTCDKCHKDVHKGKFQQACSSCHVTSDWHTVKKADFDHNKTHFPLLGKHASVACEKCHLPGKPLVGLKFDLCTQCHENYHLGQFSAKLKDKDCKECHTVDGFSPSSFSIEQHKQTKYPIVGAHLAIPCISCHQKIETGGGKSTIRFAFKTTECIDCHKNPHKKTVDKYLIKGSCQNCHVIEGWKVAHFDHNTTKFKLTGRHSEISCKKCHNPSDNYEGVDRMKFEGVSGVCVDCHTDIHKGQFAEAADNRPGGKIVKCEKCHTPSRWKADLFNHDTAAFKLDGAHIKAPCASCHKKVGIGEESHILYKPIESKCASCHTGQDSLKSDKS